MSTRSVTLALGGGGARGLAHLGVIEVLLDQGFEIERIVGVSMGSLTGAVYAFEADIKRAQQRALDYLLSQSFQEHQHTLFGASPKEELENSGGLFSWYDRVKKYLRANHLFHRVIRTPSLLPGIVLRDVVDHLLPDADISEATVPLSVVAVDLLSGHNVLLESGPLRDAVRGSSSLPGIFPPVAVGEMLLCDIGVFYSLPTTLARPYASQCLVAVDVSSGLQPVTACETALDVLMRMDEIGESLFRKHVRDEADLVIEPAVAGIEWFDFSDPEKLIAAGRRAGERAIAKLAAKFEA
jgi:NTE family protein